MHKVLIVDDARLMRNIIRGILVEAMDCTVIEARDGEEAVRLYKEHTPDVVTMDITMERLNGVDAAKAILNYDCNANVIVISSMGQERLLEECLEAGVRDFIIKPFSRDRIKAAIDHVLKHNRPAIKRPARRME